MLVTTVEQEPYWQGGAFVAAGALPVLDKQFNPPEVQVTFMFGVALGHLTATQAINLEQNLPGALSTAGQIVYSGTQQRGRRLPFVRVLPLLAEFAAQSAAVSNVLNLMSVSLAVVGAAVVLLAAWLMAEKRREEFGVLRATGCVTAAACCRGADRQRHRGGTGRGSRRRRGRAADARHAGAPLAWWLGRADSPGRAGRAGAHHCPRASRLRRDEQAGPPGGRTASARRVIVEAASHSPRSAA